MASPRMLSLLSLIAAVQLGGANAQLTNSQASDCDCFATDGASPSLFTNHKFFDFRGLAQYAGVPNTISTYDGNSAAAVTSDYFNAANWKDTWQIQRWGRKAADHTGDATVDMVNSANNVYIERDQADGDATHLTLRTVRHQNFQSVAEFDSTSQDHQYLSIRMRARVIGSSGACGAMFTYRGPSGSEVVQEADIEILTRDSTDVIHYTNQPSYRPDVGTVEGSSFNATLPSPSRWSDWHNHRIDWTPGLTTWLVNGKQLAKTSVQAPRDPALVIFNMWSDGGSWSDVMKVGDSAYLQIQWLEMAYNVSSSNSNGSNVKCSKVCQVDVQSDQKSSSGNDSASTTEPKNNNTATDDEPNHQGQDDDAGNSASNLGASLALGVMLITFAIGLTV